MKMDHRDHILLKHLQADSRISNADLADAAGMSPSACWRRVKALEEAGIIDRYGAVVNATAAGLTFQAIVHVQLARHSEDELNAFIQAVSTRREVVECYATTGQSDYQMRVLCRDLDAYNAFLETFLFRLSAVASAQTNVVLREIKRNTGIGF
ncbi:Lrp/AsnC family transcriptional regulator [uncultured Tateyamaria sp.]|uniref:Lrp/AsnC family transcriptional regulator n=1 Tax=uncultured Tateyamaria sp. TaxID=455651 RepID=UPI002616C3C9|nr:Lrp/AsnC family transcriptional regulator [uncultured Tateyamaria sp.]